LTRPDVANPHTGLIAASFATVVYNAYHCHPKTVLFYNTTNLFCGALGSYLPFQQWFNERKNKVSAALYAKPGIPSHTGLARLVLILVLWLVVMAHRILPLLVLCHGGTDGSALLRARLGSCIRVCL
jgi:hypothetical protein